MYKVKATVTIKLLVPKKPNLMTLTAQIEDVIDGKKMWKLGRYEDAYVSNIKVKKSNG